MEGNNKTYSMSIRVSEILSKGYEGRPRGWTISGTFVEDENAIDSLT